jgi:hypothetical protein
MGSGAMDSEGMGSATMGSARIGSGAMDSEGMGSATMGSGAIGLEASMKASMTNRVKMSFTYMGKSAGAEANASRP